jgi:hypothetical protein
MPRRKRHPVNSFELALDAALVRYGRAVKEREAAVQTLDKINQEIPALQQTIQALQRQLGKEVMPNADASATTTTVTSTGGSPNGNETVIPSTIPAHIAKLLPRQDLTGIGSIPAVSGTEGQPLTEDELLPDIDGTQLTEER